VGSGGIASPFLISALDRGEWSGSHPRYSLWAPEPIWGLWSEEICMHLLGIGSRGVQPADRRYPGLRLCDLIQLRPATIPAFCLLVTDSSRAVWGGGGRYFIWLTIGWARHGADLHPRMNEATEGTTVHEPREMGHVNHVKPLLCFVTQLSNFCTT
jgi:hypothetical protein